MRAFLKYIYQYRKNAFIFIVFSLIFLAVFALYDTDTEAVIYGFALCSVIGIICVISGFRSFRKKHILLNEIYQNLPLMVDELPIPDEPVQEELQNIITKLSEINRENIMDLKTIRQNNTEYFSVWVHQIKTPIAAIQMLLQDDDTDKSRELSAELFRIEQYAEMALHYIRLDSDSNDFIIQRCDLDNIVRQAVRRYAPLFIRRKIKLDYQSVNIEVLTDEKWLLFVVEQLLSNAVKYTVNGCVTIKFVDDILSVIDTGIGIAPEDLPRIFEKGYTGMSGRTDKKSTGLGLYLCKKVCDKLGHNISASSEVGKGSVFSVDLNSQQLDIE